MEFIKQLKDYSKNLDEAQICDFLVQKLSLGGVCSEKIRNVDYIVEYFKPVHEFVISTTALPGSKVNRLGI